MKIYLDGEYKCHTVKNDGLLEIETDYFDSECKEFIEGYRFVPSGKTWVREDGIVFSGEMVCPYKDYSILEAIQKAIDDAQEKSDAQMMELLDVIEQLAM